MSEIFRRELRRLMPYGLGGPLLVLAAGALMEGTQGLTAGWLVSFVLVPCLLGVATVAPDTGAGATAFLARLPLDPRRTFAVKLAAALVWLLPTMLLASLLLTDETAGSALTWRVELRETPVALLCFGAGVLGSVIADKVMPAVLMAPLVGLGALVGALAPPVVVLRVPAPEIAPVLMLGLGGALVAIAFVAFTRGDRHRSSSRPAVIAGGGVAAALALSFAGTSAAHAWSVDAAVPGLVVGAEACPASRDGKTLVVPISGERWTGLEQRVVVIDRATRSTWVVPVRDAEKPELAPDGRSLLVRSSRGAGGWLVSLETRGVRRVSNRSLDGVGLPDAIWRGDGLALLRRLATRIETLEIDGASAQGASIAVSQDFHDLGVVPGTSRVLGWDPAGIVAIDLPRTGSSERPGGRASVSAWPSGFRCVAASLSPSGRFLIARDASGFLLADLAGGPPVSFQAKPDARVPGDRLAASFAPGEDRIALPLEGGGVGIFDRATGRACCSLVKVSAGKVRVSETAVWSPDGRLAAIPASRSVVSVETGEVRARDLDVAAFVDSDTVIRAGEPLAFASLRDGTVLSRPLGGR
ncbi:hypothetical protein HY251_16565 [bacterium]|nr:hypothetical protein [bacterium]